jgi:hypothetical protein
LLRDGLEKPRCASEYTAPAKHTPVCKIGRPDPVWTILVVKPDPFGTEANQQTQQVGGDHDGNDPFRGWRGTAFVVGNARREGVTISFWQYGKVGVPLTMLTLALGIGWLQF